MKKKDARRNPWLKPDSDAFKASQTIILYKNTLKELLYITKFSNMGSLEIYHAFYNKWLPERQHLSHLIMVTKSQLALQILMRVVIRANENNGREGNIHFQFFRSHINMFSKTNRREEE